MPCVECSVIYDATGMQCNTRNILACQGIVDITIMSRMYITSLVSKIISKVPGVIKIFTTLPIMLT